MSYSTIYLIVFRVLLNVEPDAVRFFYNYIGPKNYFEAKRRQR